VCRRTSSPNITVATSTNPPYEWFIANATRELLDAGELFRISEEESVQKDIIGTNVLFNFVQQLNHIYVPDETRADARDSILPAIHTAENYRCRL